MWKRNAEVSSAAETIMREERQGAPFDEALMITKEEKWNQLFA